jgi:cation-transporting ATPase 13A1
MLTAGMFFFISNAKPLERLSPQRPHPSIFNAYFFLSLIGQFALHMGFLIYMYHTALSHMPEEERQGSDSEFKPNLVNTVCYLVQVRGVAGVCVCL